MHGPLVDVVLLSLIVLFFGVQQRRRPEAYFRFWLAGWVLVLASILVWESPVRGAQAQMMQEALRQSALACGGLAFVFSFVAKQRSWRRSLLQGLLTAVPVCLGLDLIVTEARGGAAVIVIVVAGQLIGTALVWRDMGKRGGWLLAVLLAVFPAFGWYMVWLVLHGHADALLRVALSQTFVVSGLLFSTMRRPGGRSIGAAGFFLWAACYLFDQPFMPHGLLDAIHALWTIPKYLVAFGMILKLFTKVNAEFAELSASHQRLYEEYRLLFDSNPHPMAIYDLETKYFLAVNDAAVAAYGYPREQFQRMTVTDVQVDEDEEEDGAPDELGLEPGQAKGVLRHKRANGESFDVDLTGHDIRFEGRQARFVLAVDITEREDLNRELVRRAHHDALTGLPNRVMLEDRIKQWVMRCVREENRGAFLTIDIDHFKRINDTYGHMVGDECLKATAERLRSRVRQVDTIARTGGEEFTIVIGGLKTREGAGKVCAELLRLFEEPVVVTGHEVRMTISIGVALYPDDGTEVEMLRRKSDQALYRAKQTGRNRAVFSFDQLSDQPVGQAVDVAAVPLI